ncbi:MAG: peptidase C11, partial [Lachnospiraceae bacterium]|nr:peptidase C11 [Lachnospiraceae bacterium]
LLGGYQSTDGQYYGGNDYSTVWPQDQSSDVGESLLDLAAQMLFGRAPLSAGTLQLTEKDGKKVLELDEEKWEQITDAEIEVFMDDGEGYLDLGLDNVLEYNDDGDLIDEWDGTWLTLNGHAVCVYPISDEDEDGNGLYITTKFIPALLNGERINLIVEFNEETGEDTVLGAETVLPTGAVGKGYAPVNEGDVIQPVCDYFTYEGTFEGCYKLGDPILVPEDGSLTVANMKLTGEGRMLYTVRLTDIYQAHYWVPMTEA